MLFRFFIYQYAKNFKAERRRKKERKEKKKQRLKTVVKGSLNL